MKKEIIEKNNLKAKLESVHMWDEDNQMWCNYDCPKDNTVEEYADWCVAEQSDYWATINSAKDKLLLNGWYVVDGADYFEICADK